MPHSLHFFFSILKDFGWLGNWLFSLIAFLECVPFVGAIFPGGTLISLGGFLAAQGYFKVGEIIIFAAGGAIIGDYCGYCLGRWGRPWLERTGLIKPELIQKSEKFFSKYGNKSVLWGRFLGPLRAIVPFTAGATKMKQRPFLFWNIISGIIWAFFNVGLGYFSGNIIAVLIRRWSHRLGLIILILIAAVLIYWLIKKHGQKFPVYFKQQSSIFTEKLLSGRWFTTLDEHYPLVAEFSRTDTVQEQLFGIFLIALVLIFIYILTLVM
jgi:undecaprenyl-diphosphatase